MNQPTRPRFTFQFPPGDRDAAVVDLRTSPGDSVKDLRAMFEKSAYKANDDASRVRIFESIQHGLLRSLEWAAYEAPEDRFPNFLGQLLAHGIGIHTTATVRSPLRDLKWPTSNFTRTWNVGDINMPMTGLR